jgi:hypothetical protein
MGMDKDTDMDPEDSVGTVIERVEGGDDAATPDPDEVGAEEIS